MCANLATKEESAVLRIQQILGPNTQRFTATEAYPAEATRRLERYAASLEEKIRKLEYALSASQKELDAARVKLENF